MVLWIIPLIYYGIGLSGLLYEPIRIRAHEIINSGVQRDFSESAAIETVEACFWLSALVLYLGALRKRVFQGRPYLWILFFAVLCFVAFGEECSWGQQFFHYQTPQSYAEVNAQQELNFHNINLARLLGLSEAGPYYHRLGNLAVFINPLFYMFCVTVWLILPVVLERTKAFRNLPVFRGFPVQSRCFYLAFTSFTLTYLVVDRYLFDAGELFELTLATAACVASIHQAVSSEQR